MPMPRPRAAPAARRRSSSLIGAVAGVIAGLLGVGGGIVLVPAFLYTFIALGYDGPQIMQVCLATSLATIVFTSQRSVRAPRDEGRGRLSASCAAGARASPSAPSSACIVAGGMKTTALMLIFGVLGTVVGLYLAFGRESWRLGDQHADRHRPRRSPRRSSAFSRC